MSNKKKKKIQPKPVNKRLRAIICISVAAALLLGGLLMKLMPKNKNGNMEAMGFEMNEAMMSMLGGFTILRLLGMAGGMLGIEMSKEELLDMNAKLNKIKKPKD